MHIAANSPTKSDHVMLRETANNPDKPYFHISNVKVRDIQSEKDWTSMACLEGLPEQPTWFLEHWFLDSQDQSEDVWPWCVVSHLERTKHSISIETPHTHFKYSGGGLMIWASSPAYRTKCAAISATAKVYPKLDIETRQ